MRLSLTQKGPAAAAPVNYHRRRATASWRAHRREASDRLCDRIEAGRIPRDLVRPCRRDRALHWRRRAMKRELRHARLLAAGGSKRVSRLTVPGKRADNVRVATFV